MSLNPLVKFLGEATGTAEHLIISEEDGSDQGNSTDPSKFFAPIKPPPPPWIPKIKGISMSLWQQREADDPNPPTQSDISFYQIHPFGLSQPLQPDSTQTAVPLLPDYHSEGYLFIGPPKCHSSSNRQPSFCFRRGYRQPTPPPPANKVVFPWHQGMAKHTYHPASRRHKWFSSDRVLCHSLSCNLEPPPQISFSPLLHSTGSGSLSLRMFKLPARPSR